MHRFHFDAISISNLLLLRLKYLKLECPSLPYVSQIRSHSSQTKTRQRFNAPGSEELLDEMNLLSQNPKTLGVKLTIKI